MLTAGTVENQCRGTVTKHNLLPQLPGHSGAPVGVACSSSDASENLQLLQSTAVEATGSDALNLYRPQLPQSTAVEASMQCAACKTILLDIAHLRFLPKVNVVGALEVHLILNPDMFRSTELPDIPTLTFLDDATSKRGVWEVHCRQCSAKVGDTKTIGRKETKSGPNVPLTAFGSHKVTLCGEPPLPRKKKWPAVYQISPYDAIAR